MADPQKQSDPFASYGGVSTDLQTSADTQPNNAPSTDPFSAFGGTAVQVNAPASSSPSDEEQASQTRQMLVSGLTGMPTPNMTDDDKKSFAKGKAAGAISVPVVAGATIGATEAAPLLADKIGYAKELAEYYGKEGVEAVAKMASEHPIAAKLIAKTLGGVIGYKHGGISDAALGALIGHLLSE